MFQSILFYSTKNFLKKVSQRRKKIERGDPLGFFYTHSDAKQQKKIEGGTLWSRLALYVMRETFWFCSLGQQVKFEIL